MPRVALVTVAIIGNDSALVETITAAARAADLPVVASSPSPAVKALPPAEVAILAAPGGDLKEHVEPACESTGGSVLIVAGERSLRMRDVLAAGANGLVWTGDVERLLPSAAAAVASGQVVFPGDVREQLRRPALSNREKQILGMVVLGLSNAEIANKLYVEESTVKTHL